MVCATYIYFTFGSVSSSPAACQYGFRNDIIGATPFNPSRTVGGGSGIFVWDDLIVISRLFVFVGSVNICFFVFVCVFFFNLRIF